MKTVIKAEQLYKEYKLGTINHGTLYRDLQAFYSRLRGKPDPNTPIHATQRATGERFLALRDVSFNITEGDVVGIIGKNGAGKSTLLKILSRITAPSSGTVKIRGRMASLLEVGTGFHPELTGRENIFLNGAILGMSKRDIASKLDEIIDFSGVEIHIDTPVKRYSSGMYVRLAFAVSAFLEPDILVVDEVLAVGDAEFQKKCLGKMKDVSSQGGRTVLFVSHSLDAIRRICSKGMLLDAGQIVRTGSAKEVINTYKDRMLGNDNFSHIAQDDRRGRTSGDVQIQTVTARTGKGKKTWSFSHEENIHIDVSWASSAKAEGLSVYLAIVSTESGHIVTNCKQTIVKGTLHKGEKGQFRISLPRIPLRAKYYRLYLTLADKNFRKYYDVLDENVGLPELEILPYSDDPHLAHGYFDIPYQIKNL